MIMKKNESKLKHLRKKFRTSEEDKLNTVPESMTDLKLENLSIFNKQKYDEKKVTEFETEIIGDITLSENERMILRLPPKFSVEENLPPDGMSWEGEMSYAKARMTLKKEEDEKLDDEGIGDGGEMDEEE